jgi:hypothetical protein
MRKTKENNMTAEYVPSSNGSVAFTRLEDISQTPNELLRDVVKGGLAIMLAAGALTVSATALHETDHHPRPEHTSHLDK